MADTPDNKTQDEWNAETVYGPSTVIAALDQIEDLVESSRTVPLSASIMINKAELLDLLDQAREALPEDLVAADAVVADADAVLGRADSAAETRIAEANSRASSTLDQANERAAQIISDAEEEVLVGMGALRLWTPGRPWFASRARLMDVAVYVILAAIIWWFAPYVSTLAVR